MDISSFDASVSPAPLAPRTLEVAAGGLRRLARALRHTPDRLLHPWRQRALLARLREGPPPRSILFVCFGNLCRSPYAAVRLAQLLPEELRAGIQIASAGFISAGRPSPATAVEVAAARGTHLSAHRSSTLTLERIRAADLVVVMDRVQHRWIREALAGDGQRVVLLGDLDPEPIGTRAIHDPITQPAEVFHAVYARIDRCVEALARAISA